MNQEHTMNRREFLQAATATLGAAALARSVGEVLAQGVSEKPIRVGTIGCGGMGNAHLDTILRLKQTGHAVEIVAVCDVYQPRLEAAAKKTGGRPYRNYKELLAGEDIDAVSIATPDHWHARMTVDAANAGKDVYCEKPMTYWRSLEEPKQVVKAVAQNKRVMQVGTQGMSDDIWELVARRIEAGVLGKWIHAQASDMRNGPIGVYSPKSNDGLAKPGLNLDWEAWQGPAPRRKWDPGRFFAFRSFWDYSGGVGTDFFPHILTPLVRTMGLTFPARVTASGGLYYWDDGRQVPDIFTVQIEYPGGPSLMLVGSVANDIRLPMEIRGNKASVFFEGPGAVIEPQRAAGNEAKREEIARTRGGSLDEHWLDFLRCIRTREKPRSNEVLGYHVMAALHMGLRSYHEGRTMVFDQQKEEARPA